MQRLHERYQDNENVHVVAIHFDTNHKAGTPEEYFTEHNLTMPLIPDGREIVKAYSIKMIPAFVVVGTDGSVIHKQYNFKESDLDKMSDLIENQLKGDE